jgi:hypothetical protein
MVARVTKGVLGAGFHMVIFPQIIESIKFQAKTAQGKLKAVITPTIPTGFHCSRMM